MELCLPPMPQLICLTWRKRKSIKVDEGKQSKDKGPERSKQYSYLTFYYGCTNPVQTSGSATDQYETADRISSCKVDGLTGCKVGGLEG